jgi:hypothetical protein
VFFLSALDGKIKQRVCVIFCVKIGKSSTLETPFEAFGEHSLSLTGVFQWLSHFKAGRMSVEDDKRSGLPSTSKTTENVEKLENSSTNTITEQSMSLQTLF